MSGRAVGGFRGFEVLGLRRDAGRIADGLAAGSETEDEGGKLFPSEGRRLVLAIAFSVPLISLSWFAFETQVMEKVEIIKVMWSRGER